MNRKDEMREKCAEFHTAHPIVWRLFEEYALERISKGFKHYSADAIFHRIRWETNRPEYELGEEFKIGNNHVSFYARAFMSMHPEHDGFFRTRKQISEDKPATGLDEIRPRDLI